MKKYLVVYCAPAEAMAKMATATPEEQKAGMAEWAKWKEKNGDSIVEMGEPIMLGQGTRDGNNWQNSTKQVSGYSIVQAQNMDAAKKIFENHPHVHWHPESKIGIYETMPMG